jgi:hypothetical protein
VHNIGPLIIGLFSLEFPRIEFAGNSSQCIKTAAAEGYDYSRSLPALLLGGVLPFQCLILFLVKGGTIEA